MYGTGCSKCKDFRKAFIKFKLDGKDSCGTQECSSWIHNKELHDHGEPDDVDPVVDFRFDIIYRHRDPRTKQVEDGVSINLGIEKGNIQGGRDQSFPQ